MGYRNLIVANAKRLSVKDCQLFIDDVSVPVEDINSLLIENQNAMFSAYVLQYLANQGVVVYVCDTKHSPNAVLLPLIAHSRHLKMLKYQIEISKVLQKRLWQKMVVAKLENQSRCLSLIDDFVGAKHVKLMQKKVLSGDPKNIEAQAAAYYFKRIYGKQFIRSRESITNAMLNYGYAIVRGMIARSIVCHGYEPSLGIFHKSELNGFNLADDFIEPFRPLVDLAVYQLIQTADEEQQELTPSIKHDLFRLVNYDMEVGNQKHIVSNAIELFVESYSKSLRDNAESIMPPVLIALKEHSYE